MTDAPPPYLGMRNTDWSHRDVTEVVRSAAGFERPPPPPRRNLRVVDDSGRPVAGSPQGFTAYKSTTDRIVKESIAAR